MRRLGAPSLDSLGLVTDPHCRRFLRILSMCLRLYPEASAIALGGIPHSRSACMWPLAMSSSLGYAWQWSGRRGSRGRRWARQRRRIGGWWVVDRSFAFSAYILRTAVISGHESVGTYRRESFQLLGATHTGTIYESGNPESVPIKRF